MGCFLKCLNISTCLNRSLISCHFISKGMLLMKTLRSGGALRAPPVGGFAPPPPLKRDGPPDLLGPLEWSRRSLRSGERSRDSETIAFCLILCTKLIFVQTNVSSSVFKLKIFSCKRRNEIKKLTSTLKKC